jgi:predicted glutamine amidotransferase
MCLIIRKEEDTVLSTEFLDDVRANNPDGWGILYHNREGKAKVLKGMDMADFYRAYSRFEQYNADCIIHFRLATHGKKNIHNAHPYEVLGGDNPIYLMHNGTIAIDGAAKKGKLSDTRLFIRDVLKPMLEHIKNPHEFIRTKHFEFMMESVAGDNSSRFVLFDHEGSLFYGGWYKTTTDVWVSNTYAYDVDNAYRKPKSTYNYRGSSGYYDSTGTWHSTYQFNNNVDSRGVVPLYPEYNDDRDTLSGYGEADDERLTSAFYDYEGADMYDYGDEENDFTDPDEEWLTSLQDVCDNFEIIAEDYWNLTPEEIEFCIQQFYGGQWMFFMNDQIPHHSFIKDKDGNIIEPNDILVTANIVKAALARNAAELKQQKEKKKAIA